LFTVSWNVTDEVFVPLVAVIVTGWLWAGPSEVPKDHDHVPLEGALEFVTDFVTVPTEADSVTPLAAVSLSDHVPELVAVCPSFTVTVPLVAAIDGGQFVVSIVNPLLRESEPPPGPAFVTLTLRAPVLAPDPIVIVAVSWVPLFTAVTIVMSCG
jgi:hypothetical protein